MPQFMPHDVEFVVCAVESRKSAKESPHIGPSRVVRIEYDQVTQVVIGCNDVQSLQRVVEKPFQEATSFSDRNRFDSPVLRDLDRSPNRRMDLTA